LKKLVAILLLSAHLINIGGYVLVNQYFIHRSDTEIVKQMYDNKGNSAKLQELKVPVNMPTLQDWTEYEHVEGQVQLNNTYYNYVRLKMTRDTLYLICLPNDVKANLVKDNIIMVKNMSDVLPLSKKGPSIPSAKKVNSAGYDNVYQLVDCKYAQLPEFVKVFVNSRTSHLTNPYIESPGKPPNFSC
jgi:hypothetical protein